MFSYISVIDTFHKHLTEKVNNLPPVFLFNRLHDPQSRIIKSENKQDPKLHIELRSLEYLDSKLIAKIGLHIYHRDGRSLQDITHAVSKCVENSGIMKLFQGDIGIGSFIVQHEGLVLDDSSGKNTILIAAKADLRQIYKEE